MGLLERASAKGNEKIEKPSIEPSHSLLKRAALLREQHEQGDQPVGEEKKKALPLEQKARQILKNLANLKQSYEAPAQWFRILKDHLEIKKGALLLPDSDEGVLSPWVLTGYDRTTYFRLRIPISYIYSIFHRTQHTCTRLTREELTDLAPYFSSREFGLIEGLLVYGIFFEEKLIGVLLVSESSILDEDLRILNLLFSVIDELSASLLYLSRSEKQEKLKPHIFFDLSAFNAAVPSNMKEDILLFSMDTRPIVRLFQANNPELDPFFLLRDIASFLSNFLEGAPVLIHPQASTIYFLQMAPRMDKDLLIHQLESALKRLFPELSSLPSLNIQTAPVELPLSLSMDEKDHSL
ncbi:MAG: hypothetical protein Kow009_06940 [Spirochaetales bacterium]